VLHGEWPDYKDGYQDAWPFGFVQALEDEPKIYQKSEIYGTEEWGGVGQRVDILKVTAGDPCLARASRP